MANSCYYSDLAFQPKDNAVIDAQRTIFQEIFYFGWYKDDCRTGDVDKINLLLESLNTLDGNLKFTVTSVYSKPTDSHFFRLYFVSSNKKYR